MLQQIMVCAWPRVEYHKAEVIKPLIVCWLKFEEEQVDAPEGQQILELMVGNFKMLFACVDTHANDMQDLQQLAAGSPGLRDLLVAST